MIGILIAMSDIDMYPQSIRYPQNIHLLQFITTAPELPILSELLTPITIGLSTIRHMSKAEKSICS